jgi:hypothetical protein
MSTEFSDSPAQVHGSKERPVTTIRQKLFQIGAHCEDGLIYDRWGRKVFVYRVIEFGTVGLNYDEIMDNQRRKLRELEAAGTVVKMYQTRCPQ